MKARSTNQSEVPASAAPVKGLESLQFTGTTTTNGATTVGVNLNAGKGPREGWNVGANYDIHGGTVSGSVGYTDPNTGFGLTSTIDRNGLSTSGQLNGINLATNGPDGFVMEEMNWSEQNINLAQDRTNDLRDDATLKAAGFSDEQIANMKPQDRADMLAIATADQVLREEGGYSQDAIKKMTADQRQKLAADLTRPAFDPEAIAVGAAASVGTFFAGAFAFAGGANGTGQTPTNTRADGPVVGRRREDGEDAAADNADNRIPPKPPKMPEAPAPGPTPWANPDPKVENPPPPPKAPEIPKAPEPPISNINQIKEGLVKSVPDSEKNRIISEERARVSGEIPKKMADAEKYATSVFAKKFDDAKTMATTLSTWSDNGKLTDTTKIIENGVQARLEADTNLPNLYNKYSNLANEVNARETALKNVGKDLMKDFQKAVTPEKLSATFGNAYVILTNSNQNQDVSKLLSSNESSFLKKKGGDIGSLYEVIPPKIKASIEARLAEAGLKPDFDSLPNGSLLKSNYERAIVSQYLETKSIDQKKEVMTATLKEANNIKASIKTEVTNTVKRADSLIKANLEVKIPKLDANGEPVLKNGKPVMEAVRIDNNDLTSKQRELVDKAKQEKLQLAINAEQSKELKNLMADGERIADQKILDKAIATEREALLRVPPEKIREIASREPDPSKRQDEINKIRDGLAVEHRERLAELDSFNVENRVQSIVDPSKMSQGVDGPVYKQVISTYEYFKNIDVETEVAKISDPDKKKIAREALEFIRDTPTAEKFANDTQAALCNVISAWEAAMIADRPGVSKDFPTFYKEQVLAGNIQKDTYGKDTVGVFFNADKPYLEPTQRLASDNDFSTDSGRERINETLASTSANVAQVYLDYPGGKTGEHFVIAYKDSRGDWIIKDHNEKGAPNWKNGGSLADAVSKGKIADVRLLK
jgi:hypothetical protein